MAAHIFVDNSNIFGGAQRAAKAMEPEVPWRDIRVHYKNFFSLLESGVGKVKSRVMGGSVPPGNEDLWDHARAVGYNTDLLNKVETDDGRLIEQGVDEVLHGRIAVTILREKKPQTLVLGTGDGAKSPFGTSFRDLAVDALARDWKVRVYSWKAQLSKKFRHLKSPTVEMEIHELDDWYDSITFVRGGRVVSKLTV